MAFEKRSEDVKVEAIISEAQTMIACSVCGALKIPDKECKACKKEDKKED